MSTCRDEVDCTGVGLTNQPLAPTATTMAITTATRAISEAGNCRPSVPGEPDGKVAPDTIPPCPLLNHGPRLKAHASFCGVTFVLPGFRCPGQATTSPFERDL